MENAFGMFPGFEPDEWSNDACRGYVMVSPSPAWRGRSVVVARLFSSFPKKTAALPSRRLYFGPVWPEDEKCNIFFCKDQLHID